MRLVFMGTSLFAEPSLRALDENHEVLAVYTAPEKPAGRGMKIKPGEVKDYADNAGIEVRMPLRLDNTETEYIKGLTPDVIVVVSYGLKIPAGILAIPPSGVINAHASLLPRHRGASPVNAAVIAGDRESGVSVFLLNEEWDAGDVILREKMTLDADETASSLWEKLRHLSAAALLKALESLEMADGGTPFEKQDESKVTYAWKIKREDALIDWSEDAQSIERKIRGYYGWPVAYTYFEGRTLKIQQAACETKDSGAAPGTVVSADENGIHVACGKGVLRITRLQLQCKRAMDCRDFLNGNRIKKGAVLGN